MHIYPFADFFFQCDWPSRNIDWNKRSAIRWNLLQNANIHSTRVNWRRPSPYLRHCISWYRRFNWIQCKSSANRIFNGFHDTRSAPSNDRLAKFDRKFILDNFWGNELQQIRILQSCFQKKNGALPRRLKMLSLTALSNVDCQKKFGNFNIRETTCVPVPKVLNGVAV